MTERSIRTRLVLAGAVLAAGLLAAGCAKPVRDTGLYPIVKEPTGAVPPQHTRRLLAQDEDAARAVFLVHTEAGRLPAGQLQVRLNLESRVVYDTWLEWKVVFYDGGRFNVEETEWKPLHLAPSVVHTLQANSIRPDAVEYTLFVRSIP